MLLTIVEKVLAAVQPLIQAKAEVMVFNARWAPVLWCSCFAFLAVSVICAFAFAVRRLF